MFDIAPAELLVLQRGEAPAGGRLLVVRVPEGRRQGDERPEQAAVDGGGEHVQDGRPVPHRPVPAVQDRPPEQHRRQQEAQVLKCVDELAV